ncbi:hypothetical protein CGZ80_22015 [Rhodopirellula sp. MGV]|nr:hypothetical protein CGZ80_22015 [Rhodopirellula sp. MGV]PNY34739.1 hypothetical protein C2E31_21690 [Rhodopirellula baltica]
MDEMPPEMEMHPEHGPHGGELIELGKEAYHIEFVHSDAGVTMYTLDGTATEPVSIPAETLTVSLKLEGKVKSFDLAAVASPAEESGKASAFASADPDLSDWMDRGAEGVIVVNIDGKSFTGNLSHDHGHEGHDHDEHDH